MLDVIDLDFDYQDQPLLHKVSFHLPEGGLLHLTGSNGAGKTTLIKLIAGLYQPSQGLIQFQENPVSDDLARYQRQICLVGHKTGLNPYLSIRENCLYDVSSSVNKKEIAALSEVFHLHHHLDQPCGLLSAGQKRQTALLRLWMTDAKLWLLDEPLVALDEQALTVMMNKIQEHRANGGAVLLTSHQSLPLSKSEFQEYHL